MKQQMILIEEAFCASSEEFIFPWGLEFNVFFVMCSIVVKKMSKTNHFDRFYCDFL